MADTLVGDAVAYPQDEGLSGIADDNESWASAGYMAGLARFVGSSGFVQSGLTFSGHDSANDQVDVDAGRCFIVASTSTMSVDVQSTVGGTAAPSYDTTLQGQIPILVELPTTVTNLAAQDSTLSAIWVAYDNDGTGPGSAGSVYIRTDDTGSVSAPSHPSVKLGEANPDDSTADTRANDNPTESFESLTTDEIVNIADSIVGSGDDLQQAANDEGADSVLYIGPGTHTTQGSPFSPGGNNQKWVLHPNARIKLADNSDQSGTAVVVDVGGVDEFEIKGGIIDGNAGNNSQLIAGVQQLGNGANTFIVESVEFVDCTDIVIRAQEVNDVKIIGCHFDQTSNAANTCIAIKHPSTSTSTSRAIVTENTIEGETSDDSIFTQSSDSGSRIEEVIISENIQKGDFGTSQDGGNFWFINVENRTERCVISDNIAKASTTSAGGGIQFRSANSIDFTITGNLVVGGGGSNAAIGISINIGTSGVNGSCSNNVSRNFDTTNESNLKATNVPSDNHIIISQNAVENSTNLDTNNLAATSENV